MDNEKLVELCNVRVNATELIKECGGGLSERTLQEAVLNVLSLKAVKEFFGNFFTDSMLSYKDRKHSSGEAIVLLFTLKGNARLNGSNTKYLNAFMNDLVNSLSSMALNDISNAGVFSSAKISSFAEELLEKVALQKKCEISTAMESGSDIVKRRATKI